MSDKMTRQLESVKAALEWSKQISTLAGAFIVLSATFLDIFTTVPERAWLLYTSWVTMALSLLFGVLFLAAVTALLANLEEDIDPYAPIPVSLAILHFVTFFIGLATFIVFVWGNV